MNQGTGSKPTGTAPKSEQSNRADDATRQQRGLRGRKNFWRMAMYYVSIRIGWIFKTESIIMPAVIDLIAGSGWVRGCLPMLSRLGQSVAPLLASDWLRNRSYKKYGFIATTSTMGICFWVLSLFWWITDGQPTFWLPVAFLTVYAVFFAATGINELIGATLIGKLIAVRRRGRFILVSTTLGSFSAVVCAWLLLTRWLRDDGGEFGWIFAVTGTFFVVAAGFACLLDEEADEPTGTKRTSLDLFKMSWWTLVKDRNFRMLAIIAGLMGMTMTLFPHYQSIARSRLDLGLTALLPWLIVQNLGAALFSWPAGWLGDRFGYRLVLRVLMLLLCAAPVIAIIVSQNPELGGIWFTAVFGFLGLTPVTMRVFANYTLEIVEPKYHPRYLSTMRLCMALPAVITSSLLGAMVDWVSYEFVFLTVVCLIFIGWLLTFRLDEPRNW